LHKIILYTIFVFVIFSGIVSVIPFQAHGDGLYGENVYASIGNRKMVMSIKINPPILTPENSQDRYIQLRFFDSNTGSPINNVSFFLNATKGDEKLMNELFYTKNGNMTIKFLPGGKIGQWTVQGDQEPILNGWYSPTGQVNVQSPILSIGGLYHFHITLLGFDYPNEVLPPDVKVQFDSYLSVGDFYNTSVSYKSIPYNTTIISYYDKTLNNNFDSTRLQISWSMPFDWDPKRYQDRPFLVHEELRIPSSFHEFVDTPRFSATVNGNPIMHDKIVLDNLSIKNTTIVHLFVYKQDVQQLVNVISHDAKTMDFAVFPDHTNVTTSTDIFADFGGLELKLGWNPKTIVPYTLNNLKLVFFDQLTGQQVYDKVQYDLKILTFNGGTIISKTNLVALGGTDAQSLNLPSNGIYSIQVTIKSVIINGTPDKSRNGIARGNLVIPSTVETVPEFPFAIPLLLIGMISILTLYRMKSDYRN
jgi:hypothetical protein